MHARLDFPWPRFAQAILIMTASCWAMGSSLAKVPTAVNGDEPTTGHRVLHLQELWRIGGFDDEENLLGVVDKVLSDDAGNLYLLDIQLTEVQIFSPEGEFLSSVGRAGEGPGEIRRATDLLFLPDGTLGLVQGFPGKVIKVDLQGVPAGEFRPGGDDPAAGGFFALRRAASVGNNIVMSGARITRSQESRSATNFISSFAATGEEKATFFQTTTHRAFRGAPRVEKDDFFPHDGGWALGPDGRVFVASRRNEYHIEVYSPAGNLERLITRPYESLQRSGEELERAKESMIPFRRRNRKPPAVVVEPTERDILDLRVAPDGRLWVLSSRGIMDRPEGIHSTWDVFDTQGIFVESVSLACEGDGREDALFFAGNDRVILVKEHAQALQAFRGQNLGQDENGSAELDAAPLEVVCFRIMP